MGWGESGVLRPMEGLALILRYCLGKDVAKRLIEKFTDRDSRFKGIDLETVNFNDEMFEEDIGVLVGTQQPAVSKMLKKAIRKIKEQLNY